MRRNARCFNINCYLLLFSAAPFRDSKTEQVQVSGRVYRIDSVPGLDLFNYPESSHNCLFAVIDPLKKEISIVKNSFKPYW